MIKNTNPPTPTTLNVSSSTDNVFTDALSAGSLELGEDPDDAEEDAPAELLAALNGFELELIEEDPFVNPESPEPEPLWDL